VTKPRWIMVTILAIAALAVGLLALSALGDGPVIVRLMHSRFAGASSVETMPPVQGTKPFHGSLDVAVDAQGVDRGAIVKAIQPPLEEWFGPGNVHVVDPPALGALVERPLLYIRVTGSSFWSPVAVDPPRPFTWPGAPLESQDGTFLTEFGNWVRWTGNPALSTAGWIPRADFQREIASLVAEPIIEGLVAYAQRVAEPPRVPTPTPSSPVSIDWSRPFVAECGDGPLAFTVERSDGEWARSYEVPYEEDARCTWRFSVVNTSGRAIVLGDVPVPYQEHQRQYEFGPVACSPADTGNWQPCTALQLAAGG